MSDVPGEQGSTALPPKIVSRMAGVAPAGVPAQAQAAPVPPPAASTVPPLAPSSPVVSSPPPPAIPAAPSRPVAPAITSTQPLDLLVTPAAPSPAEQSRPVAQVSAAPATVKQIKIVAGPPPVPVVKSEKKSDTSKLPLEAAIPAPAGAVSGRVQTIRLKKPSDLDGMGRLPTAFSKAPHVVGPAAPTGIIAEKKSDTSKLSLEEVVPAAVTPHPPSGGAKTIQVKTGPAIPPPLTPAAPGAAGPADAGEEHGAVTIRVKRPDSMARIEAARRAGETARISLEELGITPDATGKPAAGQEPPRTVRIKRPGETAAADAGTAAAAGGDRRTVKIARPGKAGGPSEKPPEKPPEAAPEVSEEAGPVTQRRTISVKRHEAEVSDRSQKMAQQEAELKKMRGDVPPGGPSSERPERLTWIWCIVEVAAMIVIGVCIWLFCVQLNPKNKSLNWPGRILSWNDKFYSNGERDWL